MVNDLFPTVVLCDLVIRDVNNKHTLVGVYSGDILTNSMPARLRLGLYTEFMPPESGNYRIALDIKLEGKPFLKGTVDIDGAEAGLATALALPDLSLETKVPIQLEVTASVNGGPSAVLVRKNIKQNPASSANAASQLPQESLPIPDGNEQT